MKRWWLLGAALVSILATHPTETWARESNPPAARAETRLARASQRWVDRTLDSLTLEQKAAQLIFVRAYGVYHHPDSPEEQALRAEVADLGVGGLVLFASEIETVPRLLGQLQDAAAVPLLVAADVERGLSFRVPTGPLALPSAMAVAATGDEDDARFLGEATARESLALGIHWALAPVADVNNNPANPVINVRSFGEDPQQVARLVAAFVRGAEDLGAMATAKHFPGHGDTAIDSHRGKPVLSLDRERLEAVELLPFRAAIEAGVDTVMTGHIAVPALDPSGAPATLSAPLSTALLREELGFEGLIVTDALEMKGLDATWSGGAAVRALAAGADVLLLPDDPRVAIGAIVDAVREGTLEVARLDASVRRVLTAKARLGLDRERHVDPERLAAAIARPEDQARVREIARDSVTVVRNRDGVLPIAAEGGPRILHLSLTDRLSDPRMAGIPEHELAARRLAVTRRTLGPELAAQTVDEIVALAAAHTHIVVSAFTRVPAKAGSPSLHASQRSLLEGLAASGVPLIVVAMESPYLLSELGDLPDATLCTYGALESSQRAAVEALFGEIEAHGRLPVSLPGIAALGDGLTLPRRAMTLERSSPADSGFRPGALSEVDSVIEAAVASGAFPGAVVAVGHGGRLAHLAAYGHQTYAPSSPPITVDTIYDLASLTKVVATTTMAMILVDEGRLDLDAPVSAYLPRFVGGEKERVTVRHLLTHSAGIDWWAPLYLELEGHDEYVARIEAMDLVAAPGEKTLYSDLGIILLGEILERVAGESLDRFVRRRVFEPLGMTDTGFLPAAELRDRIAPTEQDAEWRGRLLHGEVHDENAAALGGIAPHAGLFSTAGDLARFAQMLLWRGVFEHQRIVSSDTVRTFTKPAGVVDGSERALGWDTKSPAGSSAGTLFSPRSFGHTGFTGTSIWLDPERQLFVILLTNRVHPTRENQQIRAVRPAVADAVVRALIGEEGEHAPAAPTLTGLDRIAAGETDLLTGKRIGLLAHRASVTLDGRHAIDVLREQGLDLVRIFAPEHGLRGTAAAGEKVASGIDPPTGLPIVSLYGDRRAPSAEDLAGLDALVIDLQDAGVRFYTYASTMLLAIDAALEQGLAVVVLDRPNPLGGERVEGPLSAPREVVPASLLNRAPGPLVHGLTLGEMARLHAGDRAQVLAMRGWRRSMTWRDTGRKWTPPSPNLRTPEAALLYPGTCLLEATNASEGRGTEAPFQVIGAPWLTTLPSPTVPGVSFTPLEFVPQPSAAATAPKHQGETCHGWRLEVTDAAQLSPYRLGLELLAALSKVDGFAWRSPDALTRLLGNPAVAEALERGLTPEQIVAQDAEAHRAWRRERAAILLYD